jgi:hypothetical protein
LGSGRSSGTSSRSRRWARVVTSTCGCGSDKRSRSS